MQDESYAINYLRDLHTETSIAAPDKSQLNGFSASFEALYHAFQKGGTEAVLEVWPIVVRTDPGLVELSNRAGLARRIMHVSQLKNLPPLEWLINGMLPKRALCELHGAPGAGKSLLALHLAATVATQQAVIYLAAEGVSGYANRVQAWEAAHEQAIGKLYFDTESLNLLDPSEVNAFITAVQYYSPGLIIFDTLARSMIGGDENSSKDMGLVVKACDLIRHETGAAILLVHHTGKSGSNERGSSALRGGCDSMIELTNDDGLITVASSKLKDGKPFTTYYMQMVEFGESVTLMPSERIIIRQGKELTESERKVLQMLELDIFRTAGGRYTRIEEHTNVRGSTLDRVLSSLKRRGYIAQAKRGEPYTITTDGIEILSQ